MNEMNVTEAIISVPVRGRDDDGDTVNIVGDYFRPREGQGGNVTIQKTIKGLFPSP